MQSFEPTIISQVNVFLRELLRSSQQKEDVNMSQHCLRLGGDIICHLAFGYPLNTQTEDTNRAFLDAMVAINARVSLYMNWPATSILLDPLVKWLGKKRVAEFRKSVFAMIHARTAMDKDAKHDLYSMALSDKIGEGGADSSDDGLHGSELWSEATFFINAGKNTQNRMTFELPLIHFPGETTTSTTMTAVMFYLSCNPGVYERLAAEVRTTFSFGSEISKGPKLASCTYLRAVIDETLRIAPSSLGTLWRQQDLSTPNNARQPFVVDGHVIPPGVQVGINPYTLMHNAAYFPDPFTFKPERWLGPADSVEVRTMRRAHAPFALGDRGCAGKAMAYLEISLMLAKTLWYFDFERAAGEAGELGCGGCKGVKGEAGRQRKDEFQLYDIVTAAHDGPLLTFVPRGELWRELLPA